MHDSLDLLIIEYHAWRATIWNRLTYSSQRECITRIRTLTERKNIEIQRSLGMISNRNENSARFHFTSTVMRAIDSEIFGVKVQFQPEILLDPAVQGLAKAIYEEHLGIQDTKGYHEVFCFLADLLEEKGITETKIIEHCREPIYHCRGCWLLESIINHDKPN